MASLDLCLMVFFMASATVLVNMGVSSEVLEASEGPAIGSNHAPSPLPSYAKYLTDCAAKLHPHCGSQIFFGTFFGNETVSTDCCLNLVHDMGHRCHDSLTKYNLIIRSSEFKPKETQILQRNNQIWNDCNHRSYHLDEANV